MSSKIQIQVDEFQEEENIDKTIILERNQCIKNLSRDIIYIHDLYRDFSVYVGKQGEEIDNVELSMSNVEKNVENGMKNVEQASNYNKGKLFLNGALLSGGIALGGIIMFPFLPLAGIVTGGIGVGGVVVCGVAHSKNISV